MLEFGTGRYTLGIQPMIADLISRRMIEYFLTNGSPYPSWLAMATDTAWIADGHTDRHDDLYYVINAPDGLVEGNLTLYHIVALYTCASTATSSLPLDCVLGDMQGPGDIPTLPIVKRLTLPAENYFDPPDTLGDPLCEAYVYDEPPIIWDLWALCVSIPPVKGDLHIACPEYCVGILEDADGIFSSPTNALAALTTIYPTPPSVAANQVSELMATDYPYTQAANMDLRRYT